MNQAPRGGPSRQRSGGEPRTPRRARVSTRTSAVKSSTSFQLRSRRARRGTGCTAPGHRQSSRQRRSSEEAEELDEARADRCEDLSDKVCLEVEQAAPNEHEDLVCEVGGRNLRPDVCPPSPSRGRADRPRRGLSRCRQSRHSRAPQERPQASPRVGLSRGRQTRPSGAPREAREHEDIRSQVRQRRLGHEGRRELLWIATGHGRASGRLTLGGTTGL